jgi:hypothetical protein
VALGDHKLRTASWDDVTIRGQREVVVAAFKDRFVVRSAGGGGVQDAIVAVLAEVIVLHDALVLENPIGFPFQIKNLQRTALGSNSSDRMRRPRIRAWSNRRSNPLRHRRLGPRYSEPALVFGFPLSFLQT